MIDDSEYAKQRIEVLEYPAKDANDFVTAVKVQKGGLYRDVIVKIITEQQATRDRILDGLTWILGRTTRHDVAMVFFSGHGFNDPNNGDYYFLPINVDLKRLRSTGVIFHEIRDTLAALPGKALLFMDTCYSGNVMGNVLVNELISAENGVVVFASSSADQISREYSHLGNGVFTKALVEGLCGRAATAGVHEISIKTVALSRNRPLFMRCSA